MQNRRFISPESRLRNDKERYVAISCTIYVQLNSLYSEQLAIYIHSILMCVGIKADIAVYMSPSLYISFPEKREEFKSAPCKKVYDEMKPYHAAYDNAEKR